MRLTLALLMKRFARKLECRPPLAKSATEPVPLLPLRSKRSRHWGSVRWSAHARAGSGAAQAGCAGSADAGLPFFRSPLRLSADAWWDKRWFTQRVKKKEEDDFSWRDEDAAVGNEQVAASTPPPPLPGAPASAPNATSCISSRLYHQRTERGAGGFKSMKSRWLSEFEREQREREQREREAAGRGQAAQPAWPPARPAPAAAPAGAASDPAPSGRPGPAAGAGKAATEPEAGAQPGKAAGVGRAAGPGRAAAQPAAPAEVAGGAVVHDANAGEAPCGIGFPAAAAPRHAPGAAPAAAPRTACAAADGPAAEAARPAAGCMPLPGSDRSGDVGHAGLTASEPARDPASGAAAPPAKRRAPPSAEPADMGSDARAREGGRPASVRDVRAADTQPRVKHEGGSGARGAAGAAARPAAGPDARKPAGADAAPRGAGAGAGRAAARVAVPGAGVLGSTESDDVAAKGEVQEAARAGVSAAGSRPAASGLTADAAPAVDARKCVHPKPAPAAATSSPVMR
jgi:hypothetical protein